MGNNISSVASANSQAVYTGAAAQTTSAAKKEDEQYDPALPVDTVELGSSGSGSSGSKIYKPDTKTINYLKSVTDNNLNTLKKMIDKLLSGQSYTAKGMWSESYSEMLSLQSDNFSIFYQSQSSYSFEFELSVSSADDVQKQAQALIGEDGPLGIKAVSENILNFAKAISGGDSSKIDILRNAVQKGFDQVAALFGGWDKLPDITRNTYDTVMEGFDTWQNGGSTETQQDG